MLIICLECGSEVSQYSGTCIKCGFPLKKFMDETGLNNIDDIKKFAQSGFPIEEIGLWKAQQEEHVIDEESDDSSMTNTYTITVLDTHSHDLNVARYLRLMRNVGISESMSLVGRTPCDLFQNVDEETKDQIEEVLTFYEVDFETKQTGRKEYQSSFKSKKIISLGSKGQKIDTTELIYSGRYYNFSYGKDPYTVPYIIRDATSDEDAIKIQEDLKNLGIYTQIIGSNEEIKPIVSSIKNTLFKNKSFESPKQENPVVKCPYCHSVNVIRVSTASRMFSTSAVGMASKKVGKQWKCNRCKSYF